jgi:hypothetical protein
MSKIDILHAETKRMKAIEEGGKFTTMVQDITLDILLQILILKFIELYPKKTFNHTQKNLTRLQRQNESSPDLEYS